MRATKSRFAKTKVPHNAPHLTGQKLAHTTGMAARKVLDHQPGATPEIRATANNVTFRFVVAGLPEEMKLALRCDGNGDLWGAIVTEGVQNDSR